MTQFDFTSGNPANLTGGASAAMGDIQGSLTDLRSFFNGRTFNEDNLPVALLQKLGLTDSATQKGRGKSIITQSESRTNTAYGLLTTPDRVSGIVLPTDGLIVIAMQSTWFESVAGAARAAVFIGANQLKVAQASGAPAVQEAQTGGTPATAVPLHTFGGGLISENASAATSDVTTGEVVGASGGTTQNGVCHVFAAAGTYDVSVQFKASSGSVSAVNRRLWVWSIGF